MKGNERWKGLQVLASAGQDRILLGRVLFQNLGSYSSQTEYDRFKEVAEWRNWGHIHALEKGRHSCRPSADAASPLSLSSRDPPDTVDAQ